MPKSATLWFWIGCFVIVVASILQTDFSTFPGLFVIALAVGFCIWQWIRRTRELKNQVVQEKSMRLAADHFIKARMPPSPSRRKK
jgi:hypothetical protein